MSEKSENLIYTLSVKKVIFLFIYYTIFMIAGISVLTYIMVSCNYQENLMLYSIVASFASTLIFSSMKYIKYLYKACLTSRMKNDVNVDPFWEIGNFTYFLLRPVFAISFVIIIIFGLRSGIVIVVDSSVDVINDRFFYVCVLVSAIIGYSIGEVIDRFNYFSSKTIKKSFDKLNDTDFNKGGQE